MPNTDLPDEIREPAADTPQDEPKLDRRTAIAQARAIRRGAVVARLVKALHLVCSGGGCPYRKGVESAGGKPVFALETHRSQLWRKV